MTSRADDHYTDSDDDGAPRVKRRKGPKACDVCRRKKIRCDPDPSGDIQLPCLNCAVFKTECTYTYIAKKRRTQQAYIDGLQDRLHKLENLLASLAPDIDLSKVLSDDVDSSRHLSTSGLPPIQGDPRPSSPPKPTPPPPNLDVVTPFSEWRERNSSDDDEDEPDSLFIPFPAPAPSRDETRFFPYRFHGKSSGVMLLQKVMGMKRTYTGDSSSFPAPKDNPILPWETRIQTTLNPAIHFKFPPQELQDHLIEIYFRCINPYAPLFHRPSFEANVRDGLHTRDPPFGAVLLMLCAAASRWSSDPRVLSQTVPDTEDAASWSSAGWDFYFEVQMRYRRNFLHTTSVRDLQMIALACIYLQGTFNPSPAWHMAGLGLRLALDVGAHRRKMPDTGDKLESEIWKRAFWVLVVLDRWGSVYLGRPCAIWEEDIDIDLPLEVDDEYMTEEAGFKQPPNKPSYVVFFNTFVRLTHILIGALRTIYPIGKSKSMFRLVGPRWEQDMVAALDSSLNSWVDSIPEHLRWDPNRTSIDTTFYQSAITQCCYYNVQIIVHRPYITKPSSDSLTFPSLAICTNAARSCAHILEVLRHRGLLFIPILNHAAFSSAIVLLFNIWGMNKPGARVDWQSQVKDVHTCMSFINMTKGRWQVSQRMWAILRELVCVGEFPLPQGASPPFMPGNQSGQKRSRDLSDSVDTHSSTPTTGSTSLSVDAWEHRPSVSQNYAIEGLNVTSHRDHSKYSEKQEPFTYSNAQASYYHPGGSTVDLEHLLSNNADAGGSLPTETPQNIYVSGTQHVDGHSHSAHDVLTALESAYFVDRTSSLGDGVVMDVAQHALDVWGTAPSGFQWDEWQHFTNTVQSAPGAGAVFNQVPLGGQGG